MLKKSLMLLSMAFILVSCNFNATTESSTESSEIVTVEIADLISNTEKFADNKIEVTAVVNHICSHGGKKMFLIDQATEETIKVIPGENMAAFNSELVGYKVCVTGSIETLVIDEAYLQEWESEIIAEAANTEEDEHEEGEHQHAETGSKADQADQGTHMDGMENIANLRKEIAESGTDHLKFYTVVCEKIETIEVAEESAEEETE